MPCVVGKSILISKRSLEAIGGVAVLRDFLAEDFVLGREVRRAGYRVVLSADVIDTTEVGKQAKSVWDRHRRWAMMRRRLAGPLYAGELFTSALPWFLAAMTGAPGLRLAAVTLLGLRWGIEAATARLSGRPLSWGHAALLPVRDLCAAALFWAGLAGRSVSWRGRALVIGRQTRILRKAA
jgi:ceramide glucosyltransferase